MNTAPSSSTPSRTPRIFSGAPNIVIALPGWVSSTDHLILLNSTNSVISFTHCSPCGNLWHERSPSTEPHLSSFPSRKHQPVTLRRVPWAPISGSLITLSSCPTAAIFGVRNRKRERHTVSSLLLLRRGNVDKPDVSRTEPRGGYGFEYGLIPTGKCPFSRLSIMHHVDVVIRKFFTIIVTFNLVGLILAIQDVWQYPWGYSSPLCLGNLLAAILVRNELFGRILYLLVNKLFAKVRSRILILISQSHAL